MELSNDLKIMRFKKNQITQEKLSKKLDVSRQTINAIENGKFKSVPEKASELFSLMLKESKVFKNFFCSD